MQDKSIHVKLFSQLKQKGTTQMTELRSLIDLSSHQLTDPVWLARKREELDIYGAVQMNGFLTASALEEVQTEAAAGLKEPISSRRPIIFIWIKVMMHLKLNIRNRQLHLVKGLYHG